VGDGAGQRVFRLAGVGAPTPPAEDEFAYLCPADQCSRFAFPVGGATPTCRISGQALRRDRL